MKKRILSFLLVLALVFTMLPASVLAETINDDNVFVKQSRSGKCTLASAVMMLRRRAIIDGNTKWDTITESTLKSTACSDGEMVMYFNYTYMGMDVSVKSYASVSDKKAELIKILADHPEGVVIYDAGIPHAVLLTDYDQSSGIFYCADPANGVPSGRIKLSQSWNAECRSGTQESVISNIHQIWYISNKSGGGPGLVTVTLDANGGECSSKTAYVTADGKLGSLPTPTRTGFRFLGWYDAPVGGTKYTAATPITKDVTLYAQWKDLTVTGTCGSGLKWSLNEDIGTLKISGSGEMDNYSSASGLNAPWHDYAACVKALEIDKGVRGIGSHAFAELKNLKSADLGGVRSIGEGAFSGCTSLKDIKGAENVKVFGSECFSGCTSLSGIEIPSGCTGIGARAFKATAIKTLSVPASVISIGEGAFSDCAALGYAELPAGLTKIPADCFADCTALQAVIVTDDGSYGAKRSVIEANSFSGCTSLREIVIYNRAESLCVAKNAFSGCTAIKSVSLDCLSLVLDNSAFPSGAKIDYINISGEYGSVAPKAFSGVTTTIVYPANGTKWGEYAGSQFGGKLTWESYDNHVHDFTATITAPTCSEKGYTVFVCSSCSESFRSSYTKALGHDFKNGACTVCGCKNPFTDIDAKGRHIYYTDAILWAAESGITDGMTPTTFGPDGNCTRAQVVTFLWRMAGQPEPTASDTVFTDLRSGAFYTKAVLWAAENGITDGMTPTTFDPEGTVTRAQFVTLLWRYLGKPVSVLESAYKDISARAFYYQAVLWANENGITNGYSETTFAPDDFAIRAQVVTFLHRSCSIE